MDKLATIIQDIKDGKIKESDGLEKLEADFNQKERDSYRKQSNICKTLSMYDVDDYMKFTDSPENIVLQKERINRIVYFIKQALMLLSPRYRQVLWKHVIENKSYQTIGEELGISKQAAHSYVKRIPYKITNKMLKADPEYGLNYVKEILEQTTANIYHPSNQKMGFIFEREKETNGCIRKYLDNAFGEYVACNICVSCKEKRT